MFCIGLRQTFLKHQPLSRGLCAKTLRFVRDKEISRETNLASIQDIVLQRSSQTNGDIDWKGLSNELSEQRLIRRANFEKDLMSAFLLNNTKDISKVDKKLFDSMVKFFRGIPDISNNIIATSHYCHFIGHFHQFIDNSDIELIRETTDNLMNRYQENRVTKDIVIPCLIGLSKSSKDNCIHAIKLLRQMKEINQNLIKQIIESSFEFKLIEHSLDLLKKYSNIELNDELISKIIINLSQLELSFDQTIDLLTAFSNNLVVFDSKLKPLVHKLIDKFSYEMNSSFIGRNGLCLKCEQTLKDVSPEEQTLLLKQFCSEIFNKENDILMKSFPEFEIELKLFDKFMRRITSRKPLDLVIDGLNVAFTQSAVVVEDKYKLRQFKLRYPAEQIDRTIVKHLMSDDFKSFENILIIGRKHMKKWKELNSFLERQSDRISIFYAMNKTQDDCYILYATLQNPITLVLSNDFYRDYINRLSRNGHQLFERWLNTHQTCLKSGRGNGLELPDRFEHRVHISEDKRFLHIPFFGNNRSYIEWMCFVRY